MIFWETPSSTMWNGNSIEVLRPAGRRFKIVVNGKTTKGDWPTVKAARERVQVAIDNVICGMAGPHTTKKERVN